MKVTDTVHLVDGTKGSYSYLVLGQEPILVDTSMTRNFNNIMDSLSKLGMKPSDIAHIVLTHQDVDHIGNAKELKALSGATLWAPSAEIPYIHGERRGKGARRLISMLMKVDRPQIDRSFDAGDKIGGLEVIPAPGHTPGHVCLRINDVLLAGDLVTTRDGRLRPAPSFLTWDKIALQKSIRDVGSLTFDWVCPAHGDPVRRASLWDSLLQ